MAFTRKFLKALGIEEDKIDTIMDEHVATVDPIKQERDTFKADAAKLPDIQRQLDEAQKNGDGEYKTKYEQEHQALEDLKAQNAAAAENATKENLFREMLKKGNISEKWIDPIMRLADLSKYEVKDGKYTDEKAVSDAIAAEYADYTVKTRTEGANPKTPPAGGNNNVTREEFGKMSYNARVKLYNENPELYKSLTENKE